MWDLCERVLGTLHQAQTKPPWLIVLPDVVEHAANSGNSKFSAVGRWAAVCAT